MKGRVEGKSDVLIVGAGPTGCAAGIMLARSGVDVCVVDRACFPRDKVCGDAVSNEGIALVEQLGARDAVDRSPHAVVHRAAAVFPDGARIMREYDTSCRATISTTVCGARSKLPARGWSRIARFRH
jgi:2-polyprenyl-6-methoxyphenol hydroxylase-like FAD-dependent oxidoreductase